VEAACLTGLVSQNSDVLSWKESVATQGDSEDVSSSRLVAVGVCNFFELTANRKIQCSSKERRERGRGRSVGNASGGSFSDSEFGVLMPTERFLSRGVFGDTCGCVKEQRIGLFTKQKESLYFVHATMLEQYNGKDKENTTRITG
jgi:hypothetical protein